MSMIAVLRAFLDPLEHVEYLRLDRDVERGGRLVGDQHVGLVRDRHRDHGALAHTAGELVRVVVDALLGLRDTDHVEQLDRALAHVVLAQVVVHRDRFGDLRTDADTRDSAR